MKEYEFLEIHNMSPSERKKNRLSSEVREDSVGNLIATWCQIVDGVLVIKQAVADIECKHFSQGTGYPSVVKVQDFGLITDLYSP